MTKEPEPEEGNENNADNEDYSEYNEEEDEEEYESELQVQVYDRAIDVVSAIGTVVGPALFVRFLQGYLPVLHSFAKSVQPCSRWCGVGVV